MQKNTMSGHNLHRENERRVEAVKTKFNTFREKNQSEYMRTFVHAHIISFSFLQQREIAYIYERTYIISLHNNNRFLFCFRFIAKSIRLYFSCSLFRLIFGRNISFKFVSIENYYTRSRRLTLCSFCRGKYLMTYSCRAKNII